MRRGRLRRKRFVVGGPPAYAPSRMSETHPEVARAQKGEEESPSAAPPPANGAKKTLAGIGDPRSMIRAPRPSPVEHAIQRYRARSENRWRFIRAYTTTFRVIGSYLFLFWKAKLLGRAYRDQNIAQVHKKNAHLVYETILKLQGLFIKVGQALSIMANFLPEAFRVEL